MCSGAYELVCVLFRWDEDCWLYVVIIIPCNAYLAALHGPSLFCNLHVYMYVHVVVC